LRTIRDARRRARQAQGTASSINTSGRANVIAAVTVGNGDQVRTEVESRQTVRVRQRGGGPTQPDPTA